ncbi:MAG: glycosyltransferase family 2 protein [Candidatus Microsaccharimonas sp.]
MSIAPFRLVPNPVKIASRRDHRHGLHLLEPRRDWALGFITGHRTRIVLSMSLITLALFAVQMYLWSNSVLPPLSDFWGMVATYSSVLWIMAVPAAFLGLLGMLAYKYPKNLDDVPPIEQLVVFRICSKGDNIRMVRETIKRCIVEMEASPLFDYLVEVVINDVEAVSSLQHHPKVKILTIPNDYETPRGDTKYKARGLHYALEASDIPDDAWLVHLDEETQPTSSGIKGITKMIREEEASGELRIGQGAILYHRAWKKHPIMTLADNVRTGDDFARFYFQHRLGRTVFGLHGSYIVVRNDVEKLVGFDFGPDGSITEDAFWALELMERGHRARWVEGYLEEQSTEDVKDFLRQRARWYHGLMKVSLNAPVKFRWRASIFINTILWSFAPLAGLYTIFHFFVGYGTPFWVALLANMVYASFMTLYLTGLKANMDEHKIKGVHRRTGWTLLQLVLTPFFSFIESAGVVLGMYEFVKSKITNKDGGFHVVKK